MPTERNPGTTAVELDPGESALIVGEGDEGNLSVRIAAGREIAEGATDLADAQEIVLALAMRLLKDPDFQDEVLDWYYEHMDEEEEDEDEEERQSGEDEE